jgi:hypothetical protein
MWNALTITNLRNLRNLRIKKPGETLRLTGGAPPGASPLSLSFQNTAEGTVAGVTLCHLLPLVANCARNPSGQLSKHDLDAAFLTLGGLPLHKDGALIGAADESRRITRVGRGKEADTT